MDSIKEKEFLYLFQLPLKDLASDYAFKRLAGLKKLLSAVLRVTVLPNSIADPTFVNVVDTLFQRILTPNSVTQDAVSYEEVELALQIIEGLLLISPACQTHIYSYITSLLAFLAHPSQNVLIAAINMFLAVLVSNQKNQQFFMMQRGLERVLLTLIDANAALPTRMAALEFVLLMINVVSEGGQTERQIVHKVLGTTMFSSLQGITINRLSQEATVFLKELDAMRGSR
eukprot:GCRY01006112.1.p1 GENE.GCRY01006112.1~~GCRY01006112.1.p1  ORF type:complete len:229 (-),score=49.28 GCRY01006112.1:642-1328(-)